MMCLPALAAGDGRLRVHAAGRADRHDIDRFVGQHVVELVIDLAADLRPEFVGRRRERVEASGDLRPFDVRDRLGVKPRNHAAADDAETDSHAIVSLV